ncbi:hypothetical protein [Streptomyces mirabilis]|uniref:hypothetical protein n=1 Tax=Streptomyces mirabilis TaxID=68239 RepID=UPI00167D52CB|nr:hypothetical protein [Streptomyces mirabilis]
MTTAAALSRQRPAAARFRRITHIPAAAEEFLFGALSPSDCRFTLTDQLPCAELPYEEGAGLPLDLHYVTEAMHSICELAASRVPRFAALGQLAVARAVVTVEGGEFWRCTTQRRHAVMESRLRGAFPPAEPATLQCDATLLVQGKPYASGFLLLREAAVPESTGKPPRRLPSRRPAPAQVARCDPRNVVLADPRFDSHGVMLADIAPDPANTAFDPVATSRARITITVEATRQAAVLAAAELHGFSAAHCIPTRWSAELPETQVFPDMPARCRVVAGPVVRDALGRPETTMSIVLSSSDGGPAGAVTVTLAQDC